MNRYCIAKQHRSVGRQAWGVFDNETKQFVEGGFFTKSAAQVSAQRWNSAPVTKLINLWTRPGLLGSKQMFHLSRLYDTPEQAEKGSHIEPDAGWTFVCTLSVSLPKEAV